MDTTDSVQIDANDVITSLLQKIADLTLENAKQSALIALLTREASAEGKG